MRCEHKNTMVKSFHTYIVVHFDFVTHSFRSSADASTGGGAAAAGGVVKCSALQW